MSQEDDKKASKILKAGGIGVMPTDTIYGLVGSALKPERSREFIKFEDAPPTNLSLFWSANWLI